ncbi:NAD(P)/FAD-dependent oxidoreductase [Jatrophihabitans sp.]|uniref:phytoene desaturase family protein n=1 Tax=Jatrophihabitans sp. TaxID=1932789 RepID=UPI0030C71A9E|nr:hypothetical protein [Jatrophihabitans sp.]
MPTAVVVGAGPNGLTAAAVLAKAGLEVTVLEAADRIGGGLRSSELTLPGLLHDDCSAIHAMGVGSPAFDEVGLEIEWGNPEIALTHPLGGTAAGVLHHSLERTVEGLGTDGARWRSLFAPLTDHFDELRAEIFQPVLHRPRHPLLLAGFGARALLPATAVARRWQDDAARALFAGVCAHSIQPLGRPATAAIGLTLIAAAHRHDWPVAIGGSQAIADALAGVIVGFGGTIVTANPVNSTADLPPADVTIFDLAPQAIVDLLGDRLPSRVRRSFARWRFGPAAYKLDLAVQGGIPWLNEESRRAGTVHVGGTFEEVAAAEREVVAGRMPERPFMLVGQQYLADPARSVGDIHPIWTYAHVPHGYDGDATEAMLAQLERFAPGTRERIVATAARPPAAMALYNRNYVGGDILTGANTPLQTLVRPRPAVNPYSLAIPGHFICSAATPPGAGVHGMAGANAAHSALRNLR